jgi:hypothetical protein
MSLNIPSFLQAFNHLSPIKYAIGNMAPYTIRSQRFTCEDWQKLPDGKCPITTGEEVLDLYNLNKDPKMQIMALGICVVVYRLLAYVILKMAKERWLGRLWRKIGGAKKRRVQSAPQIRTEENNV